MVPGVPKNDRYWERSACMVLQALGGRLKSALCAKFFDQQAICMEALTFRLTDQKADYGMSAHIIFNYLNIILLRVD